MNKEYITFLWQIFCLLPWLQLRVPYGDMTWQLWNQKEYVRYAEHGHIYVTTYV